MTIDTARVINNEIFSQVSKKKDKMKAELKSQLLIAINSTITEQILPSIQNTPGMQSGGYNTVVDQRSSGIQKSPELRSVRKTWENFPKTGFKLSNQGHATKERSVDSRSSEQDCDI